MTNDRPPRPRSIGLHGPEQQGLAPKEICMIVGKQLAKRRREMGLTLAQVSARCGVVLQQIHKYEIGQSTISVPMLVQLSRCLGVPVSYFLDPVEQAAEEQSLDAGRQPLSMPR
jgi:transcriptional regulator with XRE-family HTH domain